MRLDPELDALAAELAVASEELHLQQQEIEAARRMACAASAAYVRVLAGTTRAVALTDLDGAVVQTSRGADAMLAREGLTSSRSLLITWFAAQDRPAVRSALTTLRRFPDRLVELGEVALRRTDRAGARMVVTGSVALGSHHERHLLWTFEPPCPPIAPAEPPSPSVSTVADDWPTTLARRLAALDRADEVAGHVVQSVSEALPQAGAVHLVHQAPSRPGIGLGPAKSAADDFVALQRRVQQGPLVEAFGGTTVLSNDLATDPRWPALRAAAPAPLRSAVAAPLLDAGAALLAVSDRPDAFDDASRTVLEQAGVHGGIALSRASVVQQLQAAIATRQRIGQAVGILMERHRATPERAFELLVAASQHANRKLRDVAVRVVETGELPGPGPSADRLVDGAEPPG